MKFKKIEWNWNFCSSNLKFSEEKYFLENKLIFGPKGNYYILHFVLHDKQESFDNVFQMRNN